MFIRTILKRVIKKIFLAPVIVILLVLGGFLGYGSEIAYGKVQHYLTEKTTTKSVSTEITPTPTKTEATPTLTPTPTKPSVPTVQPTNSPTQAPTVTPTPTQSTLASTNTPVEQLSIKAFEPIFLWADYMDVGPTEAVVVGTGFSSQTVIELFPTSLDANDPVLNAGATYSLQSITFVSSQQLRGKLPSGLYNSYYGVRVKNPDGKTVERQNVLVVSGNTQEAGSAPYPGN